VRAISTNLHTEIEELFNLKVISEQHFPWGVLAWLELGFEEGQSQPVVSIATVYPGKTQELHSQQAYDEVMLGLEGEVDHWCNGRHFKPTKGKLGYIPSGGQHSMSNTTQKPARFLSVVYPAIPALLDNLYHIEDVELEVFLKSTNLDLIVDHLAKTIGLAVSLVDNTGSLLTELKKFPDFCHNCIQNRVGDCMANGINTGASYKELKITRCKFGVYSIQSPIIINKNFLGYLGCGYGLLAEPTDKDKVFIKEVFSEDEIPKAIEAYQSLKIINHNQLKSVAEMLTMITGSLVQLIINSLREKQLNSYKMEMLKEKQLQAELESSLHEAKLKFLESQVNPHFLFNTLNTIAQTSMMEGANTAATLTYALSNLLRLSLGKTESLITIKEELGYVEDYLFIQKTRFPSRFEVKIEIDPKIHQVRIPFMSIMVLIENSIIHGFTNIRWKGSLLIRGYLENNEVIIEVVDNGSGVPTAVIEEIKASQGSFNSPFKGLGLKNVYKRLEFYYGQNFTFKIEKLPHKGTRVIMRLPFTETV